MVQLKTQVKTTFKTFLLHPKPMQIVSDRCLVDYTNREGAGPNVPYIHTGVAADFQDNGYDPDKPDIGIVVFRECPVRWAKVLAHNYKFTNLTPELLPPIFEGLADHSCLGGTHLTTALRLYRNRMRSSITGRFFALNPDPTLCDLDLKEAATRPCCANMLEGFWRLIVRDSASCSRSYSPWFIHDLFPGFLGHDPNDFYLEIHGLGFRAGFILCVCSVSLMGPRPSHHHDIRVEELLPHSVLGFRQGPKKTMKAQEAKLVKPS
jgi:hypothetical protein